MGTNNNRTRSRWGVCLNDSCQKSKDKELQEIGSRKDFVCAECGKPLKESRPPKSFWDKNGKLVIIAAVLVLICGGVVAYLMFGADTLPETKVEETVLTVVDTPQELTQPAVVDAVIADTMSVEKPNTVVAEPVEVKPASKPMPASGTIDLGYATYEGPLKNGKPDGIGGTLRFTRGYEIDLKKVPAEYVSVQKGDYISNTKFINGQLKQGQLHFSNGKQRYLAI